MKQIKKLSLSNVIGKLTRNEMRYVLAGTGYGPYECADIYMSNKNQYIAWEIDEEMATSLALEDYNDCRYGSSYGLC